MNASKSNPQRMTTTTRTLRLLLTLGLVAGVLAIVGTHRHVTAASEGKIPSMKLRFSYEALEPFVDTETMRIHFEKHYQGAYVEKTNAALRALLEATDTPDRIRHLASEALKSGELQDELVTLAMRRAVSPSSSSAAGANRALATSDSTAKQLATLRNNGGGVLNHRDYFENLAPPASGAREPAKGSPLARAIAQHFGSFESFKKLFTEQALGLFGSGWTWLVKARETGKLEVMTTPNQDRPAFDVYIPLLALDVWEHSYYLLHRNRRADYVENFWKVVDFSRAEMIFEASEGRKQDL